MGASGPGIFDDDLAADILDEYTELLRDQVPDLEATDRIIDGWLPGLAPGESDVFWFGLAAAQARVGRLEERVRDRALAALDSGNDLAGWVREAPNLAPRRARILQGLRATITGPQRPHKAIRKRRPARRPLYERGDLVRFALDDGRSLLLRAVETFDVDPRFDDGGVKWDLLLWVGSEIPSEEGIRTILTNMPPPGPATSDRDERRYLSLMQIRAVRDRLSVVLQIDWPDRVKDYPLPTSMWWEHLAYRVPLLEAYQGGPEPSPGYTPAAPWRMSLES